MLARPTPAPPDARPVVRVRGVNHSFGSGETRTQVLFDVNLEVMPGELVILSGPSGSGKTTLLTLLGGLRTLQEGEVDIWDRERQSDQRLCGLPEAGLVQVRQGIGFIFQRHNLFDSLTALQNVQMAQDLRPAREDGEARVRQLLERLGLGERLRYKPHQLSGGQRQRVAVARALINDPLLVLADEPTAALDEQSGTVVVDLLRERARQAGCTSLIVTHDSRIMKEADRIVDMQRGHVASNIVVAERYFVRDALRRCPAFAPLLPEVLAAVADQVLIGVHPDLPVQPHHLLQHPWFEVHPARTVLIQQGGPGDKFYLIRRGQVAVLIDDGQGPRQVAELGQGDFFGDQALITGKPRNATVQALDPVELYTIGRATFEMARATCVPFINRILEVYRRQGGGSEVP